MHYIDLDSILAILCLALNDYMYIVIGGET